jgi:hypothetical protein
MTKSKRIKKNKTVKKKTIKKKTITTYTIIRAVMITLFCLILLLGIGIKIMHYFNFHLK